jgi:hypothetical protein
MDMGAFGSKNGGMHGMTELWSFCERQTAWTDRPVHLLYDWQNQLSM